VGLWGGKVANQKIYDIAKTPIKPLTSMLDAKMAGKLKLVAAGLRIFKTSTSITEAGTCRIAYKPLGGAPQSSFDKMLESASSN